MGVEFLEKKRFVTLEWPRWRPIKEINKYITFDVDELFNLQLLSIERVGGVLSDVLLNESSLVDTSRHRGDDRVFRDLVANYNHTRANPL